MDAFSEYVPETGRILDGHGRISVSILDEQARVGGAANAAGIRAATTASVPAQLLLLPAASALTLLAQLDFPRLSRDLSVAEDESHPVTRPDLSGP